MSRKPRLEALLSRYSTSDRRTLSYDLPAGICVGVFNGLSITFVGIIGRRIGLDAAMLTVLSVSAFVGLLLNLWIGHLSARGRLEAWVLWSGLGSRIIAGFALIWVSPWLYLSIMSLFNIVSSFGGPAYASIMRSAYSDRHRGELMGYVRVFIQTSTALSAALAGALMQTFPGSQRLLFPLAAVFGVVSSLLFYRIKVQAAEGEGGPAPGAAAAGGPDEGFRASVASLLRDRRFIAYMAVYFVIGFADKIVVPLEPIRFVDELGMTYAEAGLVTGTVPLVGALVGYLVYAKAAARVNPFLALFVTTLLSSTRFINTALAGTSFELIPGAFLSGMSNAGWDLIPIFSLILFAQGRRLSLYFGFHATLVGLRGLIGPVVGAWLYTGLGLSISTIYLIAYASILLGAVLLYLFYLAVRRRGG